MISAREQVANAREICIHFGRLDLVMVKELRIMSTIIEEVFGVL